MINSNTDDTGKGGDGVKGITLEGYEIAPLDELLNSFNHIDSHDQRQSAIAEALLERYGLTTADEGIIFNYADDANDDDKTRRLHILRLLNESLWYAADFIKAAAYNYAENAFLSQHLDDHQDYLNAAVDQITWIRDTLHDEDGANIIPLTLALINATRQELDDSNDGYPRLGFLYGYADHFTPLASIALMNYEED